MYSSLINCIFHYIYQMKYSYCELFSHFRRRFTQNLVIITSVSFLCIHVHERIYININSIFVINMLYYNCNVYIIISYYYIFIIFWKILKCPKFSLTDPRFKSLTTNSADYNNYYSHWNCECTCICTCILWYVYLCSYCEDG